MHRILIVEDEAAVRANLHELLDAEGYGVIEAADGNTALALARAEHPDLILCDIMMPGVTGHDVLAGVRQEPSTATTPFIFLTAKADHVDQRSGMDLGADDYLIKPFSRDEILSALSARLSRQSLSKAAVEARVTELGQGISSVLPHEMRTPLNGIIGSAQLLMDPEVLSNNGEVKELAECIHVSALRLEDLVMSFLLLAELEISARDQDYAQRVLVPMPCPIGERIRSVLERVSLEVGRELPVTLDLEEATVHLNPAHLDKMLRELAQNAFKFSPASAPVQIHGKLRDGRYLLSIEDQGRGMSSTELGQLGPFVQIDRRRQEQQGMGLGLHLARRVAEAYGGSTEILSHPGIGTTVTVSLPGTAPAPVAGITSPAGRFGDPRRSA